MSADLFIKARFKITLLYFLLGAVIVAIAGYLIYADLLAIMANTLALLENLIRGGSVVDQTTVAAAIVASIDAQIRRMDWTIGIWLVLAMVLSSYLLAGITLRPVRRVMERQKRFMANVSHELRTPLSVMRTSVEATLLGGDKLGRAELIESEKSNLEEIDRMSRIIEFMLSFSNLEDRMSRLAFSRIDLAAVAEKAVDLMKRRAKAKNIKLVLAVESAVVSGNPTGLEEIVLNLLKNALSYTPSGGTVRVTVMSRYGSSAITVQDTGTGIAPRDLPNIFEPFYQGENAVNKKAGGSSGLGLALVKEIANLHDAKLSVRTVLGEGTSISVRFPSRLSRWFIPWS